MSYAYEIFATALVTLAAINALTGDPQESVWLAGGAITYATLGLVHEHRRR